MYFFERGQPEEVDFVKNLVEKKDPTGEEIKQAVAYIGQSGAFEAAFEEAKDFIVRAKEALEEAPDSEAKTLLLEIAGDSLAREK